MTIRLAGSTSGYTELDSPAVGANNTLTLPSAGTALAALIPGEVKWFAMNSAPSGFLKANGAAISRTTYANLFAAIGTVFGVGNGTTTFNLPDLRGEFARGWDDGRGIDSGRAFGSAQAHMFETHVHQLTGYAPTGSFAQTGASIALSNTGNFNTSAPQSGNFGAETRPRNVALLACIAF